MAYQSGEWVIEFRQNTAAARLTAWVKPPQLKWEIRNGEPGSISCEIPIGMEQYDGTPLRRDCIVPWHTDWYLYRGNTLRGSGIVSSINLADDRDSVLVSGIDWLGYLEHRIYPFDPKAYVNDRDWTSWPKKFGTGPTGTVDAKVVVEALLTAMFEVTLGAPFNFSSAFYTPPFIYANRNTGVDVRYKILPGDERTILEHIQTLAENSTGFEFDILPHNLEFKLYAPDRDQGTPVYRFTDTNRLIELDWTNEGPLATVTVIIGAGSSLKRGVIRSHFESVIRYRWTDRIGDAGQVASQAALEDAAAGEQFADRFPRKRASYAIIQPELLTPNFWTGGRPRTLIGNRVRVTHDFYNFHKVDADYRIMALRIEVDENGNEKVYVESEMINTPNSNPNYGGGGGGFEPA
jgi:hypothetical protein